MNNLFHAFAEYSVLIGIAVFLVISLLLAVLLGVLMRRAGVSLKPLVFFFGFLAIIAMPQIVIRLLDAFVHARQIRQQPSKGSTARTAIAATTALPVSWNIVFGPNADPSLITDGKRSLDYILSDALEARISFNAAGESASTLEACAPHQS
jgi:ABC-type dipeptide/oligopeptide/nickel transport system permease component